MDRFCPALVMFAGVVVAVSLGVKGVHGQGIPSVSSCEIAVAGMDPTDFVTRSIGGTVDCSGSTTDSACCETVKGVFAEEGAAAMCLCNAVFFSSLMMAVPPSVGVSPDQYTDMLVRCGVPVAGRTSCPGVERDSKVEPQVQSQTILAGILLSRIIQAARGQSQQMNVPTPPPPPKTEEKEPSSAPKKGKKKPSPPPKSRSPAPPPPQGGTTVIVAQQTAPSPSPSRTPQIPRFATPSPFLGPQFSPPVFPKETGDQRNG